VRRLSLLILERRTYAAGHRPADRPDAAAPAGLLQAPHDLTVPYPSEAWLQLCSPALDDGAWRGTWAWIYDALNGPSHHAGGRSQPGGHQPPAERHYLEGPALRSAPL